MGTRHLTAVKLDGEYRVAQYGQWDGYPEGQGVTVLEFARKLRREKTLERFKENLRKSRWITYEEIKAINEAAENNGFKWWEVYPQLCRDMGAEVLNYVLNADGDIVLLNEYDFAFDHIFCEFIWCINLDDGVFGLYYGKDDTKTLEPIKTWGITDPPHKDKFLKAFKEADE